MNDDPKLPPYDEDAEKALLGMALQRNDVIVTVAEVLKPNDFYFQKHRQIWSAMLALDKAKEGIDHVTLAAELEKLQVLKFVGGAAYLAELLFGMPVVVGLDPKQYARVIRECAILRGIIRVGQRTVESAYVKVDALTLAKETEQELFRVVWEGRSQSSGWQAIKLGVVDALAEIDMLVKQAEAGGGDMRMGIGTGLTVLDRVLVGWQPQELVIVGARPSMGKTAFGLGAALAAASRGKAVGIVSLEMSSRLLFLRMLSMRAGLDITKLRRGEKATGDDWWRISFASGELENVPIWVDDTSSISLEELRARARLLKVESGLDLLVVDYLQLMRLPDRIKRHEALGQVSAGLKAIAKELDCTVIAMAQVSRECERRDNKRPILSDLRESGAIEQDADVVLTLYRDEVYNPKTEDKGIAEVLVRKNRNGNTADVRVAWVGPQTMFVDLEG